MLGGDDLTEAEAMFAGKPKSDDGLTEAERLFLPKVKESTPSVKGGAWWTPDRVNQAVNYLKTNAKLSDHGALGLVARWAAVEAGGGPDSVNPTSGAYGIGQWLGSRKTNVPKDFEGQLKHAAKELNTTEYKAAKRLRSAATPEEAAIGAAMYERAEGYDPKTGRDNFVNKTIKAMKATGAPVDPGLTDVEKQFSGEDLTDVEKMFLGGKDTPKIPTDPKGKPLVKPPPTTPDRPLQPDVQTDVQGEPPPAEDWAPDQFFPWVEQPKKKTTKLKDKRRFSTDVTLLPDEEDTQIEAPQTEAPQPKRLQVREKFTIDPSWSDEEKAKAGFSTLVGKELVVGNSVTQQDVEDYINDVKASGGQLWRTGNPSATEANLYQDSVDDFRAYLQQKYRTPEVMAEELKQRVIAPPTDEEYRQRAIDELTKERMATGLNRFDRDAEESPSIQNLNLSEQEIADKIAEYRSQDEILDQATRSAAYDVAQKNAGIPGAALSGLYGGTGSIYHTLAGIVRPFNTRAYKTLQGIGTELQSVSGYRNQGQGSANTGESIAGFAGELAPGLLELSVLPGGPVGKFAFLGAAKASGAGKNITDITKQGLEGGLTGKAFGIASELKNPIARLGTVFGGSMVAGTVVGVPLEENLHRSLMNTAFEVHSTFGSKALNKFYRFWKGGEPFDILIDLNGNVKQYKPDPNRQITGGEVILDPTPEIKSAVVEAKNAVDNKSEETKPDLENFSLPQESPFKAEEIVSTPDGPGKVIANHLSEDGSVFVELEGDKGIALFKPEVLNKNEISEPSAPMVENEAVPAAETAASETQVERGPERRTNLLGRENYEGNRRRDEDRRKAAELAKNTTPETVRNLASDKGFDPESAEFKDAAEQLTGKRALEDMEPAELATMRDALYEGEFKVAEPTVVSEPEAAVSKSTSDGEVILDYTPQTFLVPREVTIGGETASYVLDRIPQPGSSTTAAVLNAARGGSKTPIDDAVAYIQQRIEQLKGTSFSGMIPIFEQSIEGLRKIRNEDVVVDWDSPQAGMVRMVRARAREPKPNHVEFTDWANDPSTIDITPEGSVPAPSADAVAESKRINELPFKSRMQELAKLNQAETKPIESTPSSESAKAEDSEFDNDYEVGNPVTLRDGAEGMISKVNGDRVDVITHDGRELKNIKASSLRSEAGFIDISFMQEPVRKITERIRKAIQDTISPLTHLAKAGVGMPAIVHAYSRISVPDTVNNFLSTIFPDSYLLPSEMAKTIRIINLDNILDGYYTYRQRSQDALKTAAGFTRRSTDERAKSMAEAAKWQQKAEAINQKYPIKDLITELLAAKNDPKIMENIDRWNQTINPLMDKLYRKVKGLAEDEDLPARGHFFKARINLLPDFKEEAMKQFGDLSTPMPGGSYSNYKEPFGSRDQYDRAASFTGDYSTDAQAVLTNVYGPRWTMATRLNLFQALIDSGNAVLGDKPNFKINGREPVFMKIALPESTGQNNRTKLVNQALWVDPKLVVPLRRVLNTDIRAQQQLKYSFFNAFQVAQAVDLVAHLKNVHTVLAYSPKTASAMKDALLRLPGIGSIDTLRRIQQTSKEILEDGPEIRAKKAEMIQNGMLRPKYPARGMQKYFPFKLSHDLLQKWDEAARIIMSDFFDKQVEAGNITGTPEQIMLNKRNFVQQIGEYNDRLMSQMMANLKSSGFSPFVVAGTTFNRMGLKMLTGDPGFKAKDKTTNAKNRAQMLLTGYVAANVIPAMINLGTTGSIGGRPGTPIGAIDLGLPEDDKGKHTIVDIKQMLGYRRGERLLGLNELLAGLKAGADTNEIMGKMIMESKSSWAHPWMGPGPGFLWRAASGDKFDLRGSEHDYMGPRKFDGANQYLENLRVAVRDTNPLFYSIVGAIPGVSKYTPAYERQPSNIEIPFTDVKVPDPIVKIISGLGKTPVQTAGYTTVKTPATKLMDDLATQRFEVDPDTEESRSNAAQLLKEAREGAPSADIQRRLSEAVNSGAIKLNQVAKLQDNLNLSPTAVKFKYMVTDNVSDIIRVWERMTSKEKDESWVVMLSKVANMGDKISPTDADALRQIGITPESYKILATVAEAKQAKDLTKFNAEQSVKAGEKPDLSGLSKTDMKGVITKGTYTQDQKDFEGKTAAQQTFIYTNSPPEKQKEYRIIMVKSFQNLMKKKSKTPEEVDVLRQLTKVLFSSPSQQSSGKEEAQP